MKRFTTRKLVFGAMCVAMSFVLGMLRLFHMPQGGSVTPAAMLPLILYAYACGFTPGLLAGCVFGLLKYFMGGEVLHLLALLLDYPVAYAAMAVCVAARLLPDRARRLRLPLAVLLGYLARWCVAVLSGALIWGSYAPEGQNVWLYSMVYNISYLGLECALAVVVSLVPGMERLTALMER